LKFQGKQTLDINVDVAAYLPPVTDSNSLKPESNRIYWSILSSRIGKSQNVGLELIVNGWPVDTVQFVADGSVRKVNFRYEADRTCWDGCKDIGCSTYKSFFY
jgi:hypothetical protein